ncbi:hypothetical protein OHA98_41130 [Streptomyces sp. NBC_00654]|uniref:DUF6197 family protein n=1 Tax=Streptomyces sp. NBC_00654 TaxID=2975799 RepID=UPI002251A656|nr:hypothetical protein [Streptomyces sp. NBC_00654]MCX4971020.1 hypothetical protein [Streptomyces sp. NBC_00654]
MTQQTAPTLSAAVFSDETLTAAKVLADDSYRPFWTGQSGEQNTGEAVARHLDATAALLEKSGWSRTMIYTTARTTDLPADDSGMTVKDMVRAVLRLIRDEIEYSPAGRLSLGIALTRVSEGDQGDTDTMSLAGSVLDVVIQAHTGSATARAMPWSERQVRTYQDIVALLRAGARFARTHGPAADDLAEPAAA